MCTVVEAEAISYLLLLVGLPDVLAFGIPLFFCMLPPLTKMEWVESTVLTSQHVHNNTIIVGIISCNDAEQSIIINLKISRPNMRQI